MKYFLILLSTSLYLFSSLANAEMKIYHWVDDDGKVHYSDTAIPGTEQLDVKEINLVKSEPVDSAKNDSISSQLFLDADEEEVIDYQATITSPEDDKAIRSNEGTINIHVDIEPAKENSQTLQLYLDGKKLGSPQISPTIRAQNIDRGTHQVQVELLDKSGTALTKTQVVTVHLQRK